MSIVDYIALFVIFILATLLGFFLNRALQGEKLKAMEDQINEDKGLKNEFASQKRIFAESKVQLDQLSKDNEQIRQDFYQLTLSYKQLQDEMHLKNAEQLNSEYDVPPELPRLKESNKLLAAEIDRLRSKMKRWKTKSLAKENKKLRKELAQSIAELDKLRLEQKSNLSLDKYEALYEKIQKLGEEAKSLIREKQQVVKKPKIKIKKRKKTESPKAEQLGIFKNQPESRKRQIFKEIINDSKQEHSAIASEMSSFDLLEDEVVDAKTLMDLVGIDSKAYAVLLNANVHSFAELADLKIAKIKSLLKKAALDPKKYVYSTWPIQASLAEKGHWNLIEEYRSKR